MQQKDAFDKAKPNGIYKVKDPIEFLNSMTVDKLPGIGYTLSQKLSNLGIKTCFDLRSVSLSHLQSQFGSKTGEMLYHYSRGQDDRIIENKPRQSVTVEVNWGIRFDSLKDIQVFFQQLIQHVHAKLIQGKLSCLQITVKAKKKLYQGEPLKYLGCGHCKEYSKSFQFSQPTRELDVLNRIGFKLYSEMNLDPLDVRGIGVHLGKLSLFVLNSPLKQSTLSFHPSPSKLKCSTNSFYKTMKAKDIDLNVFKELPKQMQLEYIENVNGFKERLESHSSSFAPSLHRNDSLQKNEPIVIDLESSPICISSQISPLKSSQVSQVQSPLKSTVIRKLKTPINKTIQNIPSTCPSQIDKDVFQSIPSSLQREIIQDYKIKKSIKMKTKADSFWLDKIDSKMNSEGMNLKEDPLPHLGGESDPIKIYKLLITWMESYKSPHPKGIQELKDYCMRLLNSHYVDILWKMMLFLNSYKKQSQSLSIEWKRMIQNLLNQMQECIHETYKMKFKMP